MNIGSDLVTSAATQFGLKLFKHLVRTSPNKNVIVSPVGVFQALTLFSLLTDDGTRAEIRAALKIAEISEDSLRRMFDALNRRLSLADGETRMSSATGLWAGIDIFFGPSLEKLAQLWNIALFSGPDVTAQTLAEWAKARTGGLLSPLLPAPEPSGLNLMNAIYYRGLWQSPFQKENTEERRFHLAGAPAKRLPLMRQSEMQESQTYHGDTFDAARIPYRIANGRSLSLHVILPRRNAFQIMAGQNDVTPLTEAFTLNSWEQCQSGYEEAIIDLILPSFTMRQSHDLKPVLKQMGMPRMFQAPIGGADAIIPVVQEACQQTYFSVDEEGTKAAALTEITMDLTAALEIQEPRREKFYVNRPFLFLLADDDSGLPLFLGVIHDPEDRMGAKR